MRLSTKTFKIEVNYSLTGTPASAGIDVKQAVALTAEVVNNIYELNLPSAKGVNSGMEFGHGSLVSEKSAQKSGD